MLAISGRVSFGEFELDLPTGELRKSGTILKLRPQPANLLCLLVSHAGELVGREEIRRLLWGEATFVDYDVGMDRCVNGIRSALCDRAHSPRYIETLPRRGYRFIAPIKRHRPFAEPTLAVLPFANLNGDPALDYFADGMTDALITELARIPTLRVISRQSVLHLKGSNRRLDEICRELRVDGAVEGSALHGGNSVRVTAQLILTEPERHVWAQSYDCDLGDVLTAQGDAARAIAACVAEAFRPVIAPRPAQVPAQRANAVAPEIVEAYLKARSELEKMSVQAIGKALQCFREVTSKAPDFARGLADYAACLASMAWFGHVPGREVFPSAKQMALKAVAIDESLGEAHRTLAFLIWLSDGDSTGAERELRRAVELMPSNAEIHIGYAIFLGCMGRRSESIAETLYGLDLNPTALLPNQAAAWIYLNNRRPVEAERQARRAIEAFPHALHPYFVLGWAAWCQGRAEEAVAMFEKAASISREVLSLSFLGHVYARLGRTDDARRLLNEIEQLRVRSYAPPIAFVVIYAGLGALDEAFQWCNTACRLRDDITWLLGEFPGIDPLRSDPRFAELIHSIETSSR